MTPIRRTATARAHASIACSLLLGATLGLGSGCVYRPNIQQGNLLKVEDLEQVQAGMTRSQVRYLLGTPMLSDPFEPDRWDYIYTFQRGREKHVDRAHFVVHFEGDKVAKLEKLELPHPAVAGKKSKKVKVEDTREPPAAPSVQQPPPDASRPGG